MPFRSKAIREMKPIVVYLQFRDAVLAGASLGVIAWLSIAFGGFLSIHEQHGTAALHLLNRPLLSPSGKSKAFFMLPESCLSLAKVNNNVRGRLSRSNIVPVRTGTEATSITTRAVSKLTVVVHTGVHS